MIIRLLKLKIKFVQKNQNSYIKLFIIDHQKVIYLYFKNKSEIFNKLTMLAIKNCKILL